MLTDFIATGKAYASKLSENDGRAVMLVLIAMQKLAKSLRVAVPTSFFERDGHHYYNTLAMIGPDGDIMGTYRKSHIPDGPGY